MDANPRDAHILTELDKLQNTDFCEAASRLEVPEAHLLHLRRSPDLVLLRPDWEPLLQAMATLGPCMLQLEGPRGLHRVELSVEDVGVSSTTAVLRGSTGMAELRLLLPLLGSAWAVCAADHPAGEAGIHVFDRHGRAAFRLLHSMRTDRRAFGKLVSSLRALEQATPPPCHRPPMSFTTAVPPRAPAALLQDWAQVRGPADVLQIQRKHGIDRGALYAALDPAFTTRLQPRGLQDLLERCVADEIPVALTMGNRAAVQLHRGIVECVAPLGHHLAVMDPTVSMIHDLRGTDTVWIVRRPGTGGLVTALEVVRPTGDVVLSLRAAHARDEGESWRWRRAIEHTAHNWRQPAG